MTVTFNETTTNGNIISWTPSPAAQELFEGIDPEVLASLDYQIRGLLGFFAGTLSAGLHGDGPSLLELIDDLEEAIKDVSLRAIARLSVSP